MTNKSDMYIRCPFCKHTKMYIQYTKRGNWVMNCRLCCVVFFVNGQYGKTKIIEKMESLDENQKKEMIAQLK